MNFNNMFFQLDQTLYNNQNNSQWQAILEGMRSFDPTDQLQCLMELCNSLVVMSEDKLNGFKVDVFLPELSRIINEVQDPNILLLVYRAIYQIIDVLPNSIMLVIKYNFIPSICERLLSLEYIDLGEQAINVLNKLSENYNGSVHILRSGGLSSLLMYIDFYPIDVQCKSMNTAVNMLLHIPQNCWDMIKDSIPIFNNLLTYDNATISESAGACLCSIATNFSNVPLSLQYMCEAGVATTLVKLISINLEIEHSARIINLAIKTLRYICHGYPEAVKLLLELDIIQIIEHLLNIERESFLKKRESISYMRDIVGLVDALLPSLSSSTFWWLKDDVSPNYGMTVIGNMHVLPLSNNLNTIEYTSDNTNDPRRKIYEANSEYLYNIGAKILPFLISIFKSRINDLSIVCLSGITKFIQSSTSAILEKTLENLTISSFIASLIGSKDNKVVATSLLIAEDLMTKLPKIFSTYFIREGVINEIKLLLETHVAKPHSGTKKIGSQILSSSYNSRTNKLSEIRRDTKVELGKTDNLQIFIVDKASFLKKTYFKGKNSKSKELKSLILYVDDLKMGMKDIHYEEELRKILEGISNILQNGITIYELIQSNLVKVLYDYFTKNNSIEHLSKKVKLFFSIFSSMKESSTPTYLILIKLLKDILDKIEEYSSPAGQDSLLNILKLISNPFSITIEPHSSEKVEDTDKATCYVHADAIAQMRAVKELVIRKLRSLSHQNDNKIQISHQRNNDQQMKEEQDNKMDIEDDIPNNKELKLFFNDIVLEDDMLVLKAMKLINDSSITGKEKKYINPNMWRNRYVIQYKYVPILESESNDNVLKINNSGNHTKNDFFVSNLVREIDSLVSPITEVDTVTGVLKILYCLKEEFAQNETIIDSSHFINNNLSNKVLSILRDPIVVICNDIPTWCEDLLKHHKHLFPFYVRHLYFKATSFSIFRYFRDIQDVIEIPSDYKKLISPKKTKWVVDRNKIVNAAIIIFNSLKDNDSALEIEYANEVGTGLGPTLEFFTLLSHEFQRKKSNMWVDDNIQSISDENSYVFCKGGLFVSPIDPKRSSSSIKEILDLFYYFGIFIAKTISDNRLVDISLSKAFYQYIIEGYISIDTLKDIFPEIITTLLDLKEIVDQKKEIENNKMFTDDEKISMIEKLNYKGVRIEDLCLYFVLPRYDFELKENGSNILVTLDNLEEYVSLVVQFLTSDCIKRQFASFKEGFSKLINVNKLSFFTIDELHTLLCGSSEKDQNWDKDVILQEIVCDHGYTITSKTVQNIVEIMSEFNLEDRKRFLQFVTGSPRLPPNGFKGLNPKLTIVRKDVDSPDGHFPSVNTCFLYLKVPDYSTKEIAREKLMTAMANGQHGFTLS